jgi:hypothetical protein
MGDTPQTLHDDTQKLRFFSNAGGTLTDDSPGCGGRTAHNGPPGLLYKEFPNTSEGRLTCQAADNTFLVQSSLASCQKQLDFK